MDDVTVVLRECGERTADAAFQLLRALFPAERLHRVREVPFSQAMRKSFEIGIASRAPWTLCIDADVLIAERGLRELLAVASMQGPEVFELQGFIGDKFFGTFRPAGNHLYRTESLPLALSHIPSEGSTTRPEHSTILAMREEGFVDVQIPSVVGIHDFDQFYVDIFRKCFLQAHKHNWLRDYLTVRWEQLSKCDEDFGVALAAFACGEAHLGEVLVDKRFSQSDFASYAQSVQIVEKPPLFDHHWTLPRVESEIRQMQSCVDPQSIAQQAVQIQYFFVNPRLASDKKVRPTGLAQMIKNLLTFHRVQS